MHVLVARGVEAEGSSTVFSGDTDANHLEKLAMDADVLVAHNAIPRSATGSILDLYMLPSTIGKAAGLAKVRAVVLSHRMTRSLGQEEFNREILERRPAVRQRP